MVPECLEGCRVLDLGSGSGRDCYMLSQLVGETGHVTGIDMTGDQVMDTSASHYGLVARQADNDVRRNNSNPGFRWTTFVSPQSNVRLVQL